jgi:hypothetical protein
MADSVTTTREAWLVRAVDMFRPWFRQAGSSLPDKIRISIGFGSVGARVESARVLGVTYSRTCSADGVNEIFISPEDAETEHMLTTVLHELIHVADDCRSGHRDAFTELATIMGFLAPMTSTPPSEELRERLREVAAELGHYPGAAFTPPEKVRRAVAEPKPLPGDAPTGLADGVDPDEPAPTHSGPSKQTTRMIKVACVDPECPTVGYTVRTTRKWLELGHPLCPSGHEMS